MASPDTGLATDLLRRWSAGEAQVAEQALTLVYDELRRIAIGRLRREPPGHTLPPTAVVHEAYLRMREARNVQWSNRTEFLAFAAHVMRRVLVDHARRRGRQKRGGGKIELTLDAAGDFIPRVLHEVTAVDAALEDLGRLDPFKARIVELRFFGGLTQAEIADQLGVSEDTVGRHWRRAKAWLRASLEDRAVDRLAP
jgi:RNA polymerase sigma factor (TIGR02999 family)